MKFHTVFCTALLTGLILLVAAGCASKTGEQANGALPPLPRETLQADIASAASGELAIGNAQNAEGKYLCPIMGQPVADTTSAPSREYDGKTYYFCCKGCPEQFDKDPAKHAANAQSDTPVEGGGCSMMKGSSADAEGGGCSMMKGSSADAEGGGCSMMKGSSAGAKGGGCSMMKGSDDHAAHHPEPASEAKPKTEH